MLKRGIVMNNRLISRLGNQCKNKCENLNKRKLKENLLHEHEQDTYRLSEVI